MSRAGRRGALTVSVAVLAAFAVMLVFGFATAGPPPMEDWRSVVIVWLFLATPAVFAAQLLWWAWWRRSGRRLADLDGPARLVAVTTATLPADRRDWGSAMTAELAHVAGPRERWAFAVGCAWAALFPPRGNRAQVATVAAVTGGAAVAAGVATGRALPGLGLPVVVFVAVTGTLATAAVARAGRLPRSVRSPVVTAVGLTEIALAVAALGYVLARYPSAGEALKPLHAVVFAVVLAGLVLLILAPPRALTTSRLGLATGLFSAVLVGAGLVQEARLNETHLGDGSAGVLDYLLFTPVLVFFLGSAVASGLQRSFAAGVQAAFWAAVSMGLLVFAVWLVEAVRWYRLGRALLLDADHAASVGVNITDAVFWVLVFVPAWVLPFGVIGAAVGAKVSRRIGRREEPVPA